MRSETIRVLIVDDNLLDAHLQVQELRRAGLTTDFRIASREREFVAALEDFSPDVILCDFTFRDFDGLSALRIAQDVVPDTPVVFVSGTISEERAAIAVPNGAADFVLKTNLMRLPDAMLRAVREARERGARRAAESELVATRERIASLLQNADIVLASYSLAEKRYFYLNAAVQRVFGRSPEDFHGDTEIWDEFVHEDDLGDFCAAWARLMVTGSAEMDYRVVHPDGSVRWVHHRAKIAYGPGGTPLRVDSVATDVTERMEQQRHVKRLSRIRDVLSAVNAAIVHITEPELLCLEACRIATSVGALAVAMLVTVDVAARTGSVEALIGEFPRQELERALQLTLSDPEHATGVLAASLRSMRPAVADTIGPPGILSGTRVRALASFPFAIAGSHAGALILGADEHDFFSDDEVELVTALTGNLSFALELAAKRARVEYLSCYDLLTGLPNRTLAHDRLTQEIAAAARRGGRLAFLIFELRRFSASEAARVESGDLVFKSVARRLSEELGPARIACLAYGRFAIVVPELHALREVMTTLGPSGLALFTEPLAVGDVQVRAAAHVGCAVYPDDGADADTMFRGATTALHCAKSADAPHQFYSPELNLRLGRRLDLEARLRRGVGEQRFVLYYQPKVELATRKLTGVEALIRWRDPERPGALVGPDEFIPVLEETGIIIDVGRWAIAEALRQHHAWRNAGLAAPRVAVNISSVQLCDDGLVEDVMQAMNAFPGESGLDLEITETGLMNNVGGAIETLKRIRALGVEIAMDDFGTGYSSLSYLFQLPICAIKIDRSFIGRMTADANMLTIVTTMISLARELKLGVIAEGVETEEQAKLLNLLRCDQMQGYLIGRPAPAAEITALLGAL